MKYVAHKGSILPNEYQQVEYIESSGGEYIDTGSIDLADDRIYIKFQITDVDTGNFRIYGARKAFQDTNKTIFYNHDEQYGLGVDYSQDPLRQYRYLNHDVTNDDIVEINLGQQIDVRLNGVLVSSQFRNYAFDNSYTSCIFQYNQTTTTLPTKMRCYHYKKWRNDNLILDLVPCYRKSNREPGMYDVVNGNFFTNQGSSKFTLGDVTATKELLPLRKNYIALETSGVGRLPEEYREVEYLESDGLQYIDTGVIPTTETKAEFTAQVLSHTDKSFEGIFGSRTANNTNAFCFGISTGNVFFSQFDNATRTGVFSNYDLNKHSYVMSKDGLYQDDNLITTYTSIKTIATTKPLIIMGSDTEDSVSSTAQRSYGAKIYESDSLIRDFIPCYRKSDGKIGMYDLQNTGKNIFAYTECAVDNTCWNNRGDYTTLANYYASPRIPVEGGKTYKRTTSTGANVTVGTWNYFKLSDGTYTGIQSQANTITMPENAVEWLFNIRTTAARNSIMVVEGTEAGAFELYPFYTNVGTGEFLTGAEVSTQELVELKSMYVAVGKPEESRLPREYQEVEYLESTGTQYIDTGVYGNQDTKFLIKFTRTGADADSSWNGTGSANRNDSIRVATAPSGTTVVGGFGDLSFRGTGEDKYKTPYGQFREVYIDKNEIRYDGVKLLDVNYTGTFTSSTPIWLAGCSNSSYSYKGKVAYAKIYENNELIRDFIPCYRKSDNVAGMYDIANNVFYTNAGTGSFIKGPVKNLPSEYQEVEYLESTGEQYIDTLQNVTTKTRIELVFQSDKQIGDAFINLFGARNSGTVTAGLFALIGSNNDIQVSSGGTSYRLNTPNLVTTAINPNIVYDNSRTTLIMDNANNVISYNNKLIPYSSYLTPTNYAYSIWLFGRRVQGETAANGYKGKIYSFKISESGGLVRDFIPCYRKSDNLAGMYDLQNTCKNLVGIFEYVGNTLSASDGQLSANASYSTSEYIAVKPNTTYTWRRYSPVDGTIARLCEYTDNKTYTNRNTLINITKAGAGQVTFTTGSTTAYIRLSKRNTDTQIQLEEGSVATTYEPYPFYVNAGTGEFIKGADVEQATLKLVKIV